MDDGMCPSCRLAAKMAAASASRGELPGQVPNYGRNRQQAQQQQAAPPQPQYRASTSVATISDSTENRALVALGYPLPPLALLALFGKNQSPTLRRQVYQSIAFTGGMAAFGTALFAMLSVPFLNISAGILLAMMFPVWLVASVVYGIKTFNGEDVRIPIVSDWIDERTPAR
jgi:uncharacterized membrane protein